MIHKILYPALGTLAVASTATAIAVPIVVTKAAKNKLSAFVANGGGSNSLAGKEHINYVALGDSETAGYVGVLGEDYLSYADFLAKSMKNADKLGAYHNLAVSGERLADVNKDIFENPYKVRVLNKADLITLTLGANDILAYLKVLNIPFNQAFKFIGNPANIEKVATKVGAFNAKKTAVEIKSKTTDHDTEEAYKILDGFKSIAGHATSIHAEKSRTEIFGNNPNLGISKKDSTKLFKETLASLEKLAKGDKSALFNIDADWWPKIFDLIKRQYLILIRDLHQAAPNAQIRVIGHLFPFKQHDKDVYTKKKEVLNDNSIMDGFNRMLSSIEEGAKTNIEGTSSFVKFENANKFKEINDNIKKLDFTNDAKFMKSVKSNALPNLTDIHPSVFGYDKLGEHLFKEVGKEMGLTDAQITANAQHSYEFGTTDDPSTRNIDESKWTRKDEEPAMIAGLKAASEKLKAFVGMGDVINKDPLFKTLFNKIFELISKGEKINLGKFTLSLLDGEYKQFESLVTMVVLNLSDGLNLGLPNGMTQDELLKDKKLFAKTLEKLIPIFAAKTSNEIIKALPQGIVLNPLNPAGSLLKGAISKFKPLLTKINILSKFVDTASVVNKQLKDWENDSKVTNETQWTLAQWGLANVFDSLFKLTKS